MPTGVSIALLTCDLRVHDNPVLHAAARDGGPTVPLFVLDDSIREAGFVPPNRAAFLADCLEDLDRSLRDRGGSLLLLQGTRSNGPRGWPRRWAVRGCMSPRASAASASTARSACGPLWGRS